MIYNVEELYLKWRDFFITVADAEVRECVTYKEQSIVLEFNKLLSFDFDFANQLLDDFEETKTMGEIVIKKEYRADEFFELRFKDLPLSVEVPIWKLRAEHLNKLIVIKGYIRALSPVDHYVAYSKYECVSCGNILNVIQNKEKYKTPSKCGCGYKGKFRELDKQSFDLQKIKIDEDTNDIGFERKPQSKLVYLRKDLTRPEINKDVNLSQKIIIVGVLKEKAIDGSTEFKNYVEANNIYLDDGTIADIQYTEHDIVTFKALAKDKDLHSIMTRSVFPNIYGYDSVKKALFLQLIGAYNIYDAGILEERGTLNILVVSSPGSAKSVMARRASLFLPRSRVALGPQASLTYDQPLLHKKNGVIGVEQIGQFCEEDYNDKDHFEVYGLDQHNKWGWQKVKNVFTHKGKQILKLKTKGGREVSVTEDHSVFTIRGGKIVSLPSNELKVSDVLLYPKNIPFDNNEEDVDVAYLLGWYVAEGWTYFNKKSYIYKLEFSLHIKEVPIAEKLIHILKERTGYTGRVVRTGEKNIRAVFNSKKVYGFMKELLGSCFKKKAPYKTIPGIIWNLGVKSKKQFLRSYLDGDGGVTTSKKLASEVLYLYSMLGERGAYSVRDNVGKSAMLKDGRVITSRHVAYYMSTHPYKPHRYPKPMLYDLFNSYQKKFIQNNLQLKSRRRGLGEIDGHMANKIEKLRFFTTPKSWIEFKHHFKYAHKCDFKKYYGEYIQQIGDDVYCCTPESKKLIKEFDYVKNLLSGEHQIVEIKEITKEEKIPPHVYDIETSSHNFLGGYGGMLCHNSGVGLIASVEKDEDMGGWTLSPGAMILANNSLIVIDEFDKVPKSELSYLNQAMDKLEVSIDKASIHQTLKTDTCVLAMANPKNRVFETDKPIHQQINLPKDLKDRFDLTFALHPIKTEAKQREIVKHIFRKYDNKDIQAKLDMLDRVTVMKYLAYAKTINPILTKESQSLIEEHYIKLIGPASEQEGVYFSSRLISNIIRIATAAARSRLSGTVEEVDVKLAMELLIDSFKSQEIMRDTGLDAFRLESVVPKGKREKMSLVFQFIKDKGEGKGVSFYEILEFAETKKINEFELNDLITKLETNGDIFEPVTGKYASL